VKRRISVSRVFLKVLALVWISTSMVSNATELHVGSGQAYSTISAAITAASIGDTIFVHDGTYTENVFVSKQLTIQSQNGYSTTTVVAASPGNHVFEVTVDNVTIEGFSIYGATAMEKAGIYLESVDDCTIENNRCSWDGSHNNNRGIQLVSSNNCTINNTIASYNNSEGIFLVSSSNNTLTSNAVNNNNVDGISISSSSSNIFDNNTVINNTYDGIRLVPTCNDNTLNNNTTTGNGDNGILLVSSSENYITSNTIDENTNGIFLASSNNNTLNNNSANYNGSDGIHLESSSSNSLDSNTVTHNEFGMFLTEASNNNTINFNTMNDNDGRWDGDGIMLWGSSNNTIANNTMNNDPGDGIEFYNSSYNTVMSNTLDNSGAAMRINYYSSNNTIINNTVINSGKGIVLEEESNYNFVSDNTITGHSDRGFEFWENASYNTLVGNIISNNGTYGIWLSSGNYNTIYLNNLSNNTISNVYSESSTTTWHSPTTIHYDFNSGTFHKGYLGNYYSDGTHTGSNGIGGTYAITNDNDDDYQLIQTPVNYSLQAWWLHSDNKMYRDDMIKAGGSVTISGGGSNIWIADQAALTSISFSGSDSWTGQVAFTSALASAHALTIEIGSSTNGSDFTAGGPDAALIGDGSNNVFTYATDTSAFTVSTGRYLALRITSIDADYSVFTGGAWSYTTGEDTVMLVNNPPVLATLPDTSMHEDGSLSLILSASDADSDDLTFSVASDTTAVTAVVIDGDTLALTPAGNWNGTAQITVSVSDAVTTVSSNFTLTVEPVNDVPINTFLPVNNGTATEDELLSVNNGSWTDNDGDSLTFTYQWYSDDDSLDFDGSAITEAIDSTYTLTSADVEYYIYAVVTADDGNGGSEHANSNYSAQVIPFVGVEDSRVATEYSLSQNYPNPFNPTTNINYDLPEQSTVSLTIFDIRGQAVMTLLDAGKPPGNYVVKWSGLDQSGNQVSTGVYFCRLDAGTYSQTIKMVYLR